MSTSSLAATGSAGDQRPRLRRSPSPWCVHAHGCTKKRARVPAACIGEHKCGGPTSTVTMCIAGCGSGWTGPESGAVRS